MRENDGRVNLAKFHCKHMCKCYNETPVQQIHVNKMFKTQLKISTCDETSCAKNIVCPGA
jgi:hypothetical protein